MGSVTEFVAHNDALVALGIVASIICFIVLLVGAGWRAGRFLLTVATNGWTSARSQWRRALVTQARRCGESATYFIAFSIRQVMLIFLLDLTGVINAVILTVAKHDPTFAVASWPFGPKIASIVNVVLMLGGTYFVSMPLQAMARRVMKIAVRNGRLANPESFAWRRKIRPIKPSF